MKIINNENPEEVLQQTLETIEEYTMKSYKLINKYKTNTFLKITNIQQQQQQHNKIMISNDCECSFTENNKTCIHHDHTTGNYINSIFSKCNLN